MTPASMPTFDYDYVADVPMKHFRFSATVVRRWRAIYWFHRRQAADYRFSRHKISWYVLRWSDAPSLVTFDASWLIFEGGRGCERFLREGAFPHFLPSRVAAWWKHCNIAFDVAFDFVVNMMYDAPISIFDRLILRKDAWWDRFSW